jgi:formylmethanofuran dehydrogenase subunit A
VIKGGELIAQDGRILVDKPGTTLYVSPEYDQQIASAIRDEFEAFYTVTFKNYPVNYDHYLPHRKEVPCES